LNLKYYCHPQKISRRVTRYLPKMAEFDFELVYKPGGGVCWALVLLCALSNRVEAKLNLLMSSAMACATCSRLVM
jgi:hypothetical protein